jgi:hypothetical protein
MALISLGVISWIAYTQITSGGGKRGTGQQSPRQTLDNVQRAANRIETQGEKRLDEAAQKSETQERQQ